MIKSVPYMNKFKICPISHYLRSDRVGSGYRFQRIQDLEHVNREALDTSTMRF
jgi:hypothetical protein